jgi:hypothetical protein
LERGGSGISPNYDSVTRPCAKEAKRSHHAKRSEKGSPLDFNSNKRAAKPRTNTERPAACKTKRRKLFFDFSSDQGANADPEKITDFCLFNKCFIFPLGRYFPFYSHFSLRK